MELTKEIIMSSLKGDLIELCKGNDISYAKKTKTQLQELLLELVPKNVLDIKSQEEIVDKVKDEVNSDFEVQTIKKEEVLNAKYEYKATEGEVLITDTPSKPLKVKKEVKKATKKVKEEVKKTSPFKAKVVEPIITDLSSNKAIYNNYLSEGKHYKLFYNGILMFDSRIQKGDIVFEENYWSFNNQKFNYKNLKFKFA